jgi:hypothetical protein
VNGKFKPLDVDVELQNLGCTPPKPPKAPKVEEKIRYFSHFSQNEPAKLKNSEAISPVPSPAWPCPQCGREATIEAVEPSLDGERMLTFWHCEPCQSYAVTPSTIKEPPKGWGNKTKQ